MATSHRETQPRYDRESWLEAAIEVLAREGRAKLRTERLARELGVTRGSFYHHFASRDEFVHALLDHWARTFTDRTNERIAGLDLPPGERLLQLMKLIDAERLDRFDIAFRSWAAQDPAIAEKVREVDMARYELVRSMLAEMGFEGADLEERVRLFLVYASGQHTVYFPEASRAARDSIERRLEILTRR